MHVRYPRLALVAILAVTAAAGCKAERCTEVRDPLSGKLRPTFECPGGQLCYQGACVAVCNAGAERSEICETNDECANSARPNCIDKRCSACEDEQVCVPVVNVCADVTVLSNDGGAREPRVPMFTPAQDGGWVDGSVFSRDTGAQQMTSAVDISHATSIRISQINRHRPAPTLDSDITINSLDIRGRGREVSTSTETYSALTSRCDILTKVGFVSTPTSASIGELRIEDADPNTPAILGGPFIASFSETTARYELDQPVPQDLLAFSSTVPPARLAYLDIVSPGLTTAGIRPFPALAESYHVIYELSPTAAIRPETGRLEDTPRLLRQGIVVANPASTGVPFRWNSPQTFPGVDVRVRITGPNYDLECVADEMAERLFVISRMLDAFRNLNNLPANDIRDLSFERVFRRRIDVPSEVERGIRVELDLEIRHAHVTQITFR